MSQSYDLRIKILDFRLTKQYSNQLINNFAFNSYLMYIKPSTFKT